MGWREIEFKDRWVMISVSLQAAAAIGTFLVALIGIWKVTPIITYQVQRQEQEAAEPAVQDEVKDEATLRSSRIVEDADDWWSIQVRSYARILELTRKRPEEGWRVSFKIVPAGGQAIVPEMTPDLLVVSATHTAGDTEVVQVPVNDKAMTPAQYIQCKINQGGFGYLPPEQRQRVETAVGRYLHRYMLPRVPPAHVRSDMSLQQLHDEILLQQDQREEAARHIRALKGVVQAAIEES